MHMRDKREICMKDTNTGQIKTSHWGMWLCPTLTLQFLSFVAGQKQQCLVTDAVRVREREGEKENERDKQNEQCEKYVVKRIIASQHQTMDHAFVYPRECKIVHRIRLHVCRLFLHITCILRGFAGIIPEFAIQKRVDTE